MVSLNGKPVSINVDLGLASIAPVLEDSFVIILRVKMNQLDARGMPTDAEAEELFAAAEENAKWRFKSYKRMSEQVF